MSDGALLAALVDAEVALTRALVERGIAPAGTDPSALREVEIDPAALARDAVAGGNPVIPLVKALRAGAPESLRDWIHTGATSQDILDTALMVVARDAGYAVLKDLVRVNEALAAFAAAHRGTVAAARTLTQHAVPTTIGLRAANWRRGLARAIDRLDDALAQLPAQLGGAAGTMAALAERVRARGSTDDSAERRQETADGADSDGLSRERPDAPVLVQEVRRAYAAAIGLQHTDTPWHTQRWPITELGDALTQAIDALGKIATDVATASRTEIGELSEPTGGGSSAMPQKQNPTRSVMVRSAALRAPQLNATLHLASALAADERPDGAWHAEWPTLRELLRLALGSASHAADLTEGLRVDRDAVDRTLAATGGLIVSERLAVALGRERAAEVVARVADGVPIADLVAPELLDPDDYIGLSGPFTDPE